MDESGILSIDNSEALFEVEYEEVTESDQYENLSEAVGDAISKFGSTISKLFSGNEEVSIAYLSSIFALSELTVSLVEHCCSEETSQMTLSFNKVLDYTNKSVTGLICAFES